MQRAEVTISDRATKPRRFLLSRSLLYGTSALAGAGLIAGASDSANAQETKIEWNVFGFINNFYGLSAIDEVDGPDGNKPNFNPFVTHWDGEYQFGGKTVLDNGLEIGVRSEIEMPIRVRDDEQYMWLEHPNFGQLWLGGDNTAMYRMGLGIWGAGGVGVPINSGWISDFIPAAPGFAVSFRSPSVSTAIDVHNDDNTITYFTPRIAGFQFGASYVPNADFDGAPGDGNTASGTGGAVDTEGETYFNGFSAGLNYVTEIQGFSFGVSGGFAHATAGDGIEAAGGDDIKQIMGGITLGFGGLTLDASYSNELDGRIASAAGGGGGTQTVGGVPFRQNTEGWSAVGGVTYTIGPWAASASYMHSEVEGTKVIDAQDELDVAQGSVAYTLGPGIDLSGSVIYAEWDDELNGAQDGVSVASGFKLSF